MDCISPLRKKVKVEGFNQFLDFPCGKCVWCITKKRYDWQVRLMIESKNSKYSTFITLTYDDNNLCYNADNLPVISVSDVQLFLKRFRKSYGKLRYYLVGEYGGQTKRPHYHALFFTDYKVTSDMLLDTWILGHVKIGNCSVQSIAYVTKYHTLGNSTDYDKPFTLMSRRPGIGSGYLTDTMIDYHTVDGAEDRNWTVMNGKKYYLPKYLLKKVFSKETLINRHRSVDLDFNTRLKVYGRDIESFIRNLKTKL